MHFWQALACVTVYRNNKMLFLCQQVPQELDQVKQLLLRSAREEPDFSNQTRPVPDFDLDLSGLVESIGMFSGMDFFT
jgi:hypothetical protein